MSKPLVSVVMPTFNHAAYIGEAISSVLSQSYSDLELIIIDNYSTDNTQRIVESFKDNRIRYFKFANNGIIAASRNYGIRQAKGAYVAFIDSDDIWLKDKLQKQIEALEKNRDYQMAFCQFQAMDSNGALQGGVFGPKVAKLEGFLYDRLIRCNFIVSSSVVVRKTVLDQVGHFNEAPKLRCVEDYDLWLRIAHRYQAVYVPGVWGRARIHPYNSNVVAERLQKALNVIDKQLLAGWATLPEVNRAKANFYFREGWCSIDRDKKLARSFFWKACALNAHNLRIILLSLLGVGISFFPFLYHRIRENALDRKMARTFLNSQNL